MSDFKDELFALGRDVLVAFLIIGIILGSLYVYSARWPPMVVIESSSMSHDDASPPMSQLGIIDTGDIVVVKKADRDDIVTYVEGMGDGYKKYGQYGDVIIYRPMGNDKRTPIIHRPLVYIKYNHTSKGTGFDIPALEKLEYGEVWETTQGEKTNCLNGTLTLHDYGYMDVEVTIDLWSMVTYAHSGFITMGDNNFEANTGYYDQGVGICPAPVRIEWVEGKARGELPWFGTLKLVYLGKTDMVSSNTWRNLWVSIGAVIVLPFALDIAIHRLKKDEEEEKMIDEEKEQREQESEEDRKEQLRRIDEAVEDMVKNDDRLF